MARARKSEEKKLKYVVEVGYGGFYFVFDSLAESTAFYETVIKHYQHNENDYCSERNIEDYTTYDILTEERFNKKFFKSEEESNEEE